MLLNPKSKNIQVIVNICTNYPQKKLKVLAEYISTELHSPIVKELLNDSTASVFIDVDFIVDVDKAYEFVVAQFFWNLEFSE